MMQEWAENMDMHWHFCLPCNLAIAGLSMQINGHFSCLQPTPLHWHNWAVAKTESCFYLKLGMVLENHVLLNLVIS